MELYYINIESYIEKSRFEESIQNKRRILHSSSPHHSEPTDSYLQSS